MTLRLTILMMLSGALVFWPFPHRSPTAPPSVSDGPSILQGTVLFQRTCLSCHGPHGDGEGLVLLPDGRAAPALEGLTGQEVTLSNLEKTIGQGGEGMPGYSPVLTPSQIKSLALYVRSLTPGAS